MNQDPPVIQFCFEHQSTDIKVRNQGRLACDRWHPDDRCDIHEALVVPLPPDRSNP